MDDWNYCGGIRLYGAPCRNKLKIGKGNQPGNIFCHLHGNQFEGQRVFPDMKLYVKISYEWPFVKEIQSKVRLFTDSNQVSTYISYLVESSNRVSRFNMKIYCFAIIETIKANRKLIDEAYDSYILDFLRNIVIHPEFNDYAQDIKRTCLKSYRLEARNRVNCFYFKHLDGLCADVIEKIISLV